jgi:hypothetical protein
VGNKKEVRALDTPKSRYNNGLVAKLMLMWRREKRREMIA